ncbi:GNAT family N-acetyltransferase [Flavobacteriaceae bacterium F89]|uniref:GNAT family N-acetyltransferase n=1 Tax=Cerina litoralis TaxID=2874477 RepID=A0AAE3JPI7_9FLAO|nr:GNAT family N-acetyltransferase [Cerina litoralis]MCG2461086.1 GNAT family N-acetyltransferase [Cerina litoralis]
MLKLKGRLCYLRALEPQDLDFLYEIENDAAVWEISGTTTPYSKHILRQYLDNAHKDIYEAKQLRLVISDNEDRPIGLVDMFDFDPKNHRAGLGVIILAEGDRNKGIGSEAISLMIDYAFSILDLRQVYANVMEENAASIHLFTKLGFSRVGTKKHWIFYNGEFKNEILFQKLKD